MYSLILYIFISKLIISNFFSFVEQVNLENAAGVDDPQLVYLYATWCVVLYYQKRYHAASSIVNRLLTTINPSSEAPSYGSNYCIFLALPKRF